MKRILLGMLAVMMLVMSACGDSSVTVVAPLEPPTITSFQFTQDRTDEFIDGSVGFFAPDSDIDTMTITVINNSGGSVQFRTTTLINLPDVIRGTIPFSIDYLAFPAGTFTISVFLTDFNGLSSTQAVGVFSIP